jgi:lipopolysaccharide transport system ATP-binding protein
MKPAISVQNLSKCYRLGARRQAGYRTLRETIMDAAGASWRGLTRLARRGKAEAGGPSTLWALNDVSFEIRPGEAVGIIGRNGAGKSTLLKVLSRIVEPTNGRAEVRGRVSSLLEVGTGFHHELTGRENIYLNGAILNMSRREIARKFDAIVAFAEIEDFLDTPVKRYSSGMYVRLGFAVAAHMAPDLLLIDEVLAVGDLKFQRKCMEFARGLRDRNATVLIVSHNMFAIKAMCSRVLYFSAGRLAFDGAPQDAIQLYEKDSRLGTLPWAEAKLGSDPAKRPIRITGVEVLDEDGLPRTVFQHGERLRVRLYYEAPRPLERPNFVISLLRSDNVNCCNYNTAMDGLDIPTVSGRGTVEMVTPPLKLVSELYAIQVLVWDVAFQRLHAAQMGTSFHVRHDVLSTHFGVFHEPARWSWRPGEGPAGAADAGLTAGF